MAFLCSDSAVCDSTASQNQQRMANDSLSMYGELSYLLRALNENENFYTWAIPTVCAIQGRKVYLIAASTIQSHLELMPCSSNVQ